MKGSLIIVAFFVAGIIVGVTHLLPPMSNLGNISYITLCALIFLVGFMIGNDAEIFKKFKRLNRLYMLLPLMTIVGTLAGCAITTCSCLTARLATASLLVRRSSPCLARRSWCGGSASWLPSRWAVPPLWTPRFPSSHAPVAKTL